MVKQFLKIAGVKSEKEFYKRYPTKQSFFDAHPDAEMLDMAMYGGAYQGGGGIENYIEPDSTLPARRQRAANLRKQMPPSTADYFEKIALADKMERNAMEEAHRVAQKISNQNMREIMREIDYRKKLDLLNQSFNPFEIDLQTRQLRTQYQMGGGMEQQAAAQGAQSQQEQVIEFIAQALQQGADPQEIMQQLVEAGIPQQQAGQLIEAVAQQLQQMMAQGQGGMSQGQMPQQGMMKHGGSAYSGTYLNGTYFRGGGAYVPTYADMAYNPDATMYATGGSFNNPGFEALPPQVQAKIMASSKKSKKMVGGDLKVGGEYEMSQGEIDDLIKKGYKVKYIK